jgi:hypothetical protein
MPAGLVHRVSDAARPQRCNHVVLKVVFVAPLARSKGFPLRPILIDGERQRDRDYIFRLARDDKAV